MAKFLSQNLRLATNQEVEFGSTGQRHLAYDATHLRVSGGSFTIGASGAGIDNILDEDNMSSDSATALATQQSIKAYVDSFINGLDWQESVLSIAVSTSVPPTEVLGDRYLIDNTGAPHADWDGAGNWDVVQFNGTTWDVVYDASGDEGGAAWVEDENKQYVHNGTSWVTLNASIGLTPGTVASRTLRWTGTAWTESAALTNDDSNILTTGDLTVQGGDLTVGVATSQLGTLTLAGSTSGTMSITTAVAASGTWTFPNTGTAGALSATAGGVISTGILDVAYGGTGLNTSAVTDGQILIGNDANNDFDLAAIAGTTNEVVVTNGAGTITLSLPSNVYLGTSGFLGRDGGDGFDFATDTEIGVTIDSDADSFVFSDAAFTINSDSAVATRALRMSDLDNSAYVGLKANDTTTTYTLTMPATDSTGSQALHSNGSGVLSWISVATGETLPTSTAQYSLLVADAAGGWAEDTGAKVTSGSLDLTGTIQAGSSNVQITNSAGNLQQTYNFTTNNVLTDDDGVYAALEKLDLEFGADGGKRKHARQAIASAQGSIAVDFTTAGLSDYSDTNYTVTYALTNTTDATPSQYAMILTTKATTGFTVTFSGDTDSANYVLEWVCVHD